MSGAEVSSKKEKLLKILRADSPRAIAENVPDSAAEFLLAAPGAVFILATAAELLKCLFYYNAFSLDIVWINYAAAVLGALGAALCFVKLRYKGPGVMSAFNMTAAFFGVMTVWMLLSTAVNGLTYEAKYGDGYRCESLMSFIIYLWIYWFVSSLLSSDAAKKRLIDLFLSVSAIMSALVIIHVVAARLRIYRVSFFTSELNSAGGVVGVFLQINHYGYHLVIAGMLAAAMYFGAEKLSRKILYLLSFSLTVAVLILNNTFGAYLASFAGLCFMIGFAALRSKKFEAKSLVPLALFIAITLIMSVWLDTVITNIATFFGDVQKVSSDLSGRAPEGSADGAGTSRWRLWTSTAKMISERPILGWGVEGIGERLTAEAYSDRPHNELLEYSAFFGMPAAVCYLGGVVAVFWRAFRRRRELSPCAFAALTAAVGYFVSSMFGNTMYYTAPMFFVMLGLAEGRGGK